MRYGSGGVFDDDLVNINKNGLKFDAFEDMRTNDEFISLLADDEFCVLLWGSIVNCTWVKAFDPSLSDAEQVQAYLTYEVDDRTWSASFRGMGGIIASIRNEFHNKNENYMDWYCSGEYGVIAPIVREAMFKLGWVPLNSYNASS